MARLDRVNGRLGARRARGLGTAGLLALGARAGDGGQAEALRRGPFAAAVPGDGPLPPAAEVEARLRRLLAGEGAALLPEVEGAAARRVLAAFLDLEEAEGVKAVLRGAEAGAAPERILAAATPDPARAPAALARAAAARSAAAAVAELVAGGHPLGAPLAEALSRRPHGGLLPLEAAADRAAALRAAAAARRAGEDGRVLLDHLADRADAANAALLLTLAGAGPRPPVEVEPLLRPGGRRLAAAQVLALAGAPAAEVRAAVAGPFPALAAEAPPWADDLALERTLLARARRAARARPLSVAVAIAWLLERRAEARRVALLLRGAALGLPAEELVPLVEMGGGA